MSTPPATGSFLFQGPSVTNTTRGPLFEQWLAFTQQLVGGGARQTLAMSSGSITPAAALVTVDTQAAAPTGNLDAIQQTGLPVGSVVVLRSADPARVVTVRHNQGSAPAKILLANGSNLVLTSTTIMLALEATSGGWNELWRWYGTASASWQSFLGLGAAAALGLALTADAQAGTSNAVVVTPARVADALATAALLVGNRAAQASPAATDLALIARGSTLYKAALSDLVLGAPRSPFDSGLVAVTAGSSGEYVHGLGAVPRLAEARLVCQTTDRQFLPGQEVSAPDLGVYASPTVVGWTSTSPITVNNGTGTYLSITPANWKARVRAWL